MYKAASGQQVAATVPADAEEPVAHAHLADELPQSSEPSLAERYDWLEAMINHVPDYIYAKDLEGRFLFANRAIVLNNGLERIEDMVGLTESDIHPSAAADAIAVIERRVMETGEPDLGFEERRLRGEGWLMMSRVPLRDKTGKVIGVVGASRDISARKRGEALMKAQAQLLKAVAKGVRLDPFLSDVADLLEEVIPGTATVILLHDEGAQELHIAAASPSARTASVLPADILDNPASWRRLAISSGDGGQHGVLALRISCHEASLWEFLTGVAQTVGIAIDRHYDAERITFLAEHDALTGLPNRTLLDRKLDDMLRRANKTSRKVAVVFLDIDNFKLVNDSLGHAAGDELLKIVANRISAEIGHGNMISRIGGDEFILALEQTEEDFVSWLARIREAVARPLTLAGMNLQLTCSIGMACFDMHGKTATELFANADMAMYRAKENGRNSIEVFDPAMAESARQKLGRSEELRRAVERDEFVLHFQPQKDMISGEIIGVEALVRWNHPTDGLVFPGDFIPLAEESGLIVPIGEAVLRKACSQAKKWQEQGLPPVKIGVNMSARQFQEHGMTRQVAAALAESGLEPQWLEIEVTESLLMRDVQGAIMKMHELNALGVSLAIDDFGTGYSSLSTLKRFPLSRLKIDRSFIADIPDDADDMAITSAIVSLARSLELDVIAEGVETEEQARFLSRAGCHAIQGYLFSRPIPAEEVTRIMRKQP
ncbi:MULTISPECIES: putative bifunctional diguanylate cyclase/phosphodiesterase [Rhizobium]|uniref:Diguanylate cyclase (GGDEF)-like protein/PAS domain S-box-containing protein n=1 Tax=Rhizobium paranaense TaxID=1650438 RepID=A0A7W9D1H3_9HYPH|nr:GGDEF and EAL domain-containing protein [Rhizobium paranaense]MBB5574324.1 diguanylate cyclase (GGDEF)-like protein/PAS domain S-box-containing protein [Rhizobium paranaense]